MQEHEIVLVDVTLQGGLLQRDSRNTDSCGLAERRETASKSSDAAHQQTSF